MLHLHRSERADLLVEALGDVLRRPLEDAMSPEVVCVPTRGVERWITQRLSRRLGTGPDGADGVCANVEFPFPGRLLADVAAAACGCAGADDWWEPARTVWPLVSLVDEHLDDPVLGSLSEHLRTASPELEGSPPRRFGAARHLAELYDRYGLYRPAMLVRWLGAGGAGDGSGEPPEGDELWQAHLWRLLRALTEVPSPAERFLEAPARLRHDPSLASLPPRLSLFGLTRLPASHLLVLQALAEHRELHLFLLHPSGRLWDKVTTCVQGRPPGRMARAEDPTERLPQHPLLRSWGRDAREMQVVLAGHPVAGGVRDDHRPVAAGTGTLLALVQDGVRQDRPPPGPPAPGQPDPRPVLAPDDNSLMVYSCHGRARQVEVAREAVLHLMAADMTLEPRDVIVMCPDIELFAPLVQACFGAPAALPEAGPGAASPETSGGGPALVVDGSPELRARLADRSLRQTNPVLSVAARLLELAGSRLTATEVLDFASQGPVSRRFGLVEDDLAVLQRWLAGTGVRWGADASYRRPWHLDNLADGTWELGLDRLALGVAMAAGPAQVYQGLLPFEDVAGTDVQLVGRLCELQERLAVALGRLSGRQRVGAWSRALTESTLELAEGAEAWEAQQLRDVGARLSAQASSLVVDGPELDLAEARALFGQALQGRPTRANFRTGDITVCTLVPMRSVPHRVVCLLGLDDGLFPRQGAHDGDDLLGQSPEMGDRDVPSEDRQLLLDALLAAGEHLVITYEGRDQHLNQRRPPAVTVAELLDVVDRTVRGPSAEGPARRHVVVEHPLQPFDRRNFLPRVLGCPGPWRFDRINRDGARALSGPRRAVPVFTDDELPPLETTSVALAGLVRFLEHPVRAFLRERLGYFGDDEPEQLRDSIPVELGPLEKWSLGDRLLEAYLRSGELEGAIAAELGRGLLPPAPIAGPVLREVVGVVQALAQEVMALPCAAVPGEPVEVEVALADGTTVVGRVPGVRQGTLLRCTYSKLRAKHRVRAWAQFLALTAAYPGTTTSAVTIAQAEASTAARPRVSTCPLRAFAGTPAERAAKARALLAGLVGLYRRGMREPLPLYCSTSQAWAAAVQDGADPVRAAQEAWGPSEREERPREGAEPEHLLVLGGQVDLADLLSAPSRSGDPGAEGPAASERTRFGRLAVALWAPILDHEQLSR